MTLIPTSRHHGGDCPECTGVRGCVWGAMRLLADAGLVPEISHRLDPAAWHRVEREVEAAYQRVVARDGHDPSAQPEATAEEWRTPREPTQPALF